MKIYKISVIFIVLFSVFSLLVKTANAACSNPILTSCSYDGTVDGVDDGTGGTNSTVLTIGDATNSPTLTIGATQTIAVGTVTIVNGSIIIVDGGKLLINTPLWMVDADADTYSATTTVYAQASPPTNGVRKSTITSATVDCCDSDINAHPNQTQPYTVATACGGYDYNCDLSETQQYTTTYSCSTAGCDAYHDTVVTGFNGSVAACGTSTTDNYRTATVAGTCAGNNTCAYTSSTVTQSCL